MSNAVMEAVKKIERARPNKKMRVIKSMKPGAVIQQGDLYIHCVGDEHPMGDEMGKSQVQIALGTGNGARHVACGKIAVFQGRILPAGVSIPNVDSKELLGPVIVAQNPWSLKHPEHASFKLPAGKYQVTYQYDPKTMRRVAD